MSSTSCTLRLLRWSLDTSKLGFSLCRVRTNGGKLHFFQLSIHQILYQHSFLFLNTGFRQVKTLREAFLKSVLSQEPAWFDVNGGIGKVLQVSNERWVSANNPWKADINNNPFIYLQGLNEDSISFQNAVSEKFGNFLRNITTCVAGLIVGKISSKDHHFSTSLLFCFQPLTLFLSCAAFYRGWDMAFVIVATLPFLVGVGMAISVVTGRLSVRYFCVYLLSILSQQRNRVLLMNFLFTAVFLFLLSRSWYPRPISNLMRSLRKH